MCALPTRHLRDTDAQGTIAMTVARFVLVNDEKEPGFRSALKPYIARRRFRLGSRTKAEAGALPSTACLRGGAQTRSGTHSETWSM